MNNNSLNDVLGYHQTLPGQAFNRQVMSRLLAQRKQRQIMVTTCTLLGLLLSLLYCWASLPLGTLPQLLTPLNGALVLCMGLFLVWLWTDVLADG